MEHVAMCREGTAAKKTRELIRKKFNNSPRLNEVYRNPETGEPVLSQNSNREQTNLNYAEHEIRGTFFPNRKDPVIKFEPGVARILIDESGWLGGEIGENYGRDVVRIKGILKVIAAHVAEYDCDFNGMGLDQLEERFGEDVKTSSEADYERVNSAEYIKNDSYKIVEIHSFDEAKKYYEYTNPKSRWCLTHMETQWKHYIAEGANRAYFVLKDGFEDMKPEKGENCPLDEYGLSMICVIVTNDMTDENRSMLCTCTCRWNHDNGGSDNVMDAWQISNVIGESFYKAFKPFSVEELHAKGIYTFKEKLEKYNETRDRNWFDYVGENREGCVIVEMSRRWNFIDKYGNFIWKGEKWFDRVGSFNEGYVAVRLNGKYNFIDKDGNLLWKGEEWFDYVGRFDGGYAAVEQNGKWTFIDNDGNFLWNGEKWFDCADLFKEGCAPVKLNGKWTFIDKDGNFLWNGEKWFDNARPFSEGCASIMLDDKSSFIDKDGNLLFGGREWFENVSPFKDGWAGVRRNGKWSFINKNGELIRNGELFDHVYEFHEGYAKVVLNGKYNFIDKKGNLLSPDQWFDNATPFYDGYATVKLNERWRKIDKKGNLTSLLKQTLLDKILYFIQSFLFRKRS